MKPMNCSFSTGDGVLRAGDQVLASPGLARSEFDQGPGRHSAARRSAPGFVMYDLPTLQLWGHRFVAGIRFCGTIVHGVTLMLEQGRVAALGYDATEDVLVAEKKMLTALLSKHLGCTPSSTSLGVDVFEFPWGGVLSTAELKSASCGIEIRYR